jgi:hypothetical protein
MKNCAILAKVRHNRSQTVAVAVVAVVAVAVVAAAAVASVVEMT